MADGRLTVHFLIMNDTSNQSSTISHDLDDLKNQDIHNPVTTFIQSNLDQPFVRALVSLLDKIAAKADLQRLISQLLSTLTDPQLYIALVNALKAHIEAHPWATAFFIIGVILMVNPLAWAGFGSLGPVAGKIMVSSSAHFTE
jgi:hypothetical protein